MKINTGLGDAFVLKVDEKYLNGLWNISNDMAEGIYIQWKEHIKQMAKPLSRDLNNIQTLLYPLIYLNCEHQMI